MLDPRHDPMPTEDELARLAGFLSMMLFLAILTVGFAYEWMKGALEWE